MTPMRHESSLSLMRWLVSTAVAGITMGVTVVVFAYGNFETKEHAREVKEDIRVELTKINAKLDMMAGLKPGAWQIKDHPRGD